MKATTVDAYLAAQPKPVRDILASVRDTIRRAVPDAQESISYKMPAYKLRGKAMLQFAGWSEHYALYAASSGVVSAFASELRPYDISKGTIRFPYTAPAPSELIERIARFRAAEIAKSE